MSFEKGERTQDIEVDFDIYEPLPEIQPPLARDTIATRHLLNSPAFNQEARRTVEDRATNNSRFGTMDYIHEMSIAYAIGAGVSRLLAKYGSEIDISNQEEPKALGLRSDAISFDKSRISGGLNA